MSVEDYACREVDVLAVPERRNAVGPATSSRHQSANTGPHGTRERGGQGSPPLGVGSGPAQAAGLLERRAAASVAVSQGTLSVSQCIVGSKAYCLSTSVRHSAFEPPKYPTRESTWLESG